MYNTLTSTARVGVSVMVDVASSSIDGPVALTVISARHGISLSYLQQIVARLRRHALVRAMRGPGGGYLLGRPAAQISVADIVTAVSASAKSERHTGAPSHYGYGCDPALWVGLSARLRECLSGIALSDLIGDFARQRNADLHADLADSDFEQRSIQRGISKKPVLMAIRPTRLNSVFALGAPAFE